MTGKNIDVSNYKSWEQVTLPDGTILYIVPGTGYAYDPFLSQAKGRSVFRPNPKDALDRQKQADEHQQELEKQQKQAASPVGQLTPILGGTAGIVGANTIINATAPAHAIGLAGPGQVLMSDGTINGAGAAATTVPSVPTTTTQAFTSAATTPVSTTGATAVQSLEDGSTLMSDGTIQAANMGSVWTTAPANGSFGQIAGGIGAAKGVYDTFNSWQNGKSGRAGLTEFGAGVGQIVAGPLGAGVGGVLGNVAGYGLQGHGILNHIALAADPFTLPLEIARDLGFNPIHKTTKQFEQERWGQVDKDGITDAKAAFDANHPEGDTGVWQTGQFAGKKWNFEDAQTMAKEDPAQFRLVLGNYQTFGNDWAKYTPDQQNQIVQRLIAGGLYKPDHGDIIIKDKDAALKIKDEILGTASTTTAVTPAVATNTQGQTTQGAVLTPSATARLPQSGGVMPVVVNTSGVGPRPTMVINNPVKTPANIPGGAAIITKPIGLPGGTDPSKRAYMQTNSITPDVISFGQRLAKRIDKRR